MKGINRVSLVGVMGIAQDTGVGPDLLPFSYSGHPDLSRNRLVDYQRGDWPVTGITRGRRCIAQSWQDN